jgi:hypothetical protein
LTALLYREGRFFKLLLSVVPAVLDVSRSRSYNEEEAEKEETVLSSFPTIALRKHKSVLATRAEKERKGQLR